MRAGPSPCARGDGGGGRRRELSGTSSGSNGDKTVPPPCIPQGDKSCKGGVRSSADVADGVDGGAAVAGALSAQHGQDTTTTPPRVGGSTLFPTTPPGDLNTLRDSLTFTLPHTLLQPLLHLLSSSPHHPSYPPLPPIIPPTPHYPPYPYPPLTPPHTHTLAPTSTTSAHLVWVGFSFLNGLNFPQ